MISVLRGNTAYCVQLSGEDLSRYSNRIKSVVLSKCPYYCYVGVQSQSIECALSSQLQHEVTTVGTSQLHATLEVSQRICEISQVTGLVVAVGVDYFTSKPVLKAVVAC